MVTIQEVFSRSISGQRSLPQGIARLQQQQLARREQREQFLRTQEGQQMTAQQEQISRTKEFAQQEIDRITKINDELRSIREGLGASARKTDLGIELNRNNAQIRAFQQVAVELGEGKIITESQARSFAEAQGRAKLQLEEFTQRQLERSSRTEALRQVGPGDVIGPKVQPSDTVFIDGQGFSMARELQVPQVPTAPSPTSALDDLRSQGFEFTVVRGGTEAVIKDPKTGVVQSFNLQTGEPIRQVTGAPQIPGVFEGISPSLFFQSPIQTGAEVLGRASRKAIEKIESESRKRKELQRKGLDVPFKTGVVGGVGGIAALQIPETSLFFSEFIKAPTQTTRATIRGLRALPGKAPELSRVIRQDPERILGRIVGEIAGFKLGSTLVAKAGRLVEVPTALLDPRFSRVKTTIKGTRTVDVPVDGRMLTVELLEPGDLQTMSLRQQVEFAGKTGPVASAQRDLFKLFKREVKVDKPKPTPTSPELERAFFGSPFDIETGAAQLRVSRLGLEPPPTAGVFDIISGDVQLRAARPQAIIFPDEIIARFPKSIQDIQRKLKANLPLTTSEAVRLQEFQLTPSGQFKPIGFVSPEGEFVLAPGEIIRSKGVKTVTLIDGRKVKFIEGEIAKGSARTTELIKKRRAGTLTAKELDELSGRLAIESRFGVSSIAPSGSPILKPGFSLAFLRSRPFPPWKRVGLSSSILSGRPQQRFTIGASGIVSARPSRATSLRPSLVPSVAPSVRPSVSPSPFVSPSPQIIPSVTARPRPQPRPSPQPSGRPAPSPLIRRLIRGITREKLKKISRRKLAQANSFDVLVRKNKKFVKIADDLPFNRAIKRGRDFAETNIAATFKLRPDRSRARLPDIPTQSLSNFRRPKARSKLKDPFGLTFIEKKNKRLNTKSEVSQIMGFKRKAPKRKKRR